MAANLATSRKFEQKSENEDATIKVDTAKAFELAKEQKVKREAAIILNLYFWGGKFNKIIQPIPASKFPNLNHTIFRAILKLPHSDPASEYCLSKTEGELAYAMKAMNNTIVAISYNTGKIELWDIIKNKLVKTYKIPRTLKNPILAPLAILEDMKVLIIFTDTTLNVSYINIIDFTPKEPVCVFTQKIAGRIDRLSVVLPKKLLITLANKNEVCDNDTGKTIKVWEMNSDSKTFIPKFNFEADGVVKDFAVLFDHQFATASDIEIPAMDSLNASASTISVIQLWDLNHGVCLLTARMDCSIHSILEFPNCRIAFSNLYEVGIVDYDKQTHIILEKNQGDYTLTRFSNNYLLGIRTKDFLTTIKIWDAETGALLDMHQDTAIEFTEQAFAIVHDTLVMADANGRLFSYKHFPSVIHFIQTNLTCYLQWTSIPEITKNRKNPMLSSEEISAIIQEYMMSQDEYAAIPKMPNSLGKLETQIPIGDSSQNRSLTFSFDRVPKGFAAAPKPGFTYEQIAPALLHTSPTNTINTGFKGLRSVKTLA